MKDWRQREFGGPASDCKVVLLVVESAFFGVELPLADEGVVCRVERGGDERDNKQRQKDALQHGDLRSAI
jgi:hypothetical protein